MKIILIYPPQWTPLNPHFSLMSIASQLRQNNHKVEIRDLNIEFYNKILKKEYLKKSLEKAFKMKEGLFQELSKKFSPNKKTEQYSENFQKKLAKYTKIKETEKNSEENLYIIDSIEEAVSIMKCKTRFYDSDLLIRSLNTIDAALEIASLPFCPSLLQLHDYNNPFLKLTFESIKKHCLDKSTNMFYEFYEEKISEISYESPDIIGISINSSSQIIPGLTLSMMLKSKTKAHINIGGNFFGRVSETLLNNTEFFELFAHSLIVEEGEKPIAELVKHLEGKININEVPNLMYLENKINKINFKTEPLTLNEINIQDLEGFPLDAYFTPHIVLSVQSSRGCYWRKCSFCDQDFGQNSSIKDIDKLFSELKYLKEKFNISHFEFIDESVSPVYLENISKRISEENIEINWFINARLENAFTHELLEKTRQAGLRMILWGFESGSNEVMKLINKGIDLDKRLEILRDAKEADIWNFVYIFFGFPTETWDDALKTIDIICQNTDIISSYGRSVFTLGKHTKLRESCEKYSITKILENEEEFSPSYKYETSKGMNSKEISEAANLCTKICNEAYESPLWMYLRYREILFLYICKYGANIVQKFKKH
ncbi:MAG: radical SAM protein [bacterium]